MTYVRLSGPKDRRSPRLRPTIEQDVDLSAVSVVVDVSSADGRQQCPSNGRQRTLEYGPLNPAGSGPQPSCIKHENRQSVARGNLRNRAKLRSRQCIGIERAVICTALWKAKRIARRTCAVFCPAVRRHAHILRPYPERARTRDIIRVSLLVKQSVSNRLDSGEASKRLTVDS
jgi:hypothetical protein